MKKNQRGLTLFESGLAIASVVAVISGAVMMYGGTMSSGNTQSAVDELNTIRQGADKLRQIGSGAITNAAMTNADLIPEHMIAPSVTGGVSHSLRGGVEVGTLDSGATFFVKFRGIQKSYCGSIIPASLNTTPSRFVMYVGGSSVGNYTAPYSVNSIISACRGRASVDMEWHYR